MSIMRAGVILTACLGATQAAAQADKTKPARAEYQCLNTAREDFQNSKLDLLKLPAPKTIEATVSERRLEEQYCLRVARCVTKGDASRTGDLQASMEFSNCLEEVSLEKYNAKRQGD
jgi:hypothetical protein